MKFPITGLAWLLMVAVIFCAAHPYRAGMRLNKPKPAATVVHR